MKYLFLNERGQHLKVQIFLVDYSYWWNFEGEHYAHLIGDFCSSFEAAQKLAEKRKWIYVGRIEQGFKL